jgi:TonB family protein
MSPLSLLFSSDEETSQRMVQALSGLELEIERCPDVFTAIEWLTSRSFDVIVADWDSGPEAAFLLKNARELKLNKAAFTLALTSGTSNVADQEDSPDLILTKPLIPDQVKYAVLSNDRFLGCMKAWIARGDFSQTQPASVVSGENPEQRPQLEQPSPIPPAARPSQPSPAGYFRSETGAPLHLTFATLDRGLFRSMNKQNNGVSGSGKVKRYNRNPFLLGSVLTVAFVSVGYIFGQPLRIQSVFASVATAYRRAVEMKASTVHSAKNAAGTDPSILVQATGSQRLASSRPRARGIPGQAALPPDQVSEPPAETLQADAGLDQGHLAATSLRIQIPESLKTQLPEPTQLQPVTLRRSPSLLSQLEPVTLPEDLSQALLMQKVTPSYPEQALKAGLQGAVVLQAWIGKDGSIRDLKLMGGSFLLGQAAVKAVKQWRYKPYLRNGVAVEAQTYVTVNFRLP